jgi:hypothetical protein
MPWNTLNNRFAAPGSRFLIYCRDCRCGHHIEINANCWADDVRLSDVEPKFFCTKCCQRGGEIRPKFGPARMGSG